MLQQLQPERGQFVSDDNPVSATASRSSRGNCRRQQQAVHLLLRKKLLLVKFVREHHFDRCCFRSGLTWFLGKQTPSLDYGAQRQLKLHSRRDAVNQFLGVLVWQHRDS
uniref:(northern house mosquito) hypothetical protein n=1 Tax=Culex pipiens TaxID=7175 RepID=A0A8D8FUK9_CULPI